ncbi:hypothetical protein [Streptomyces sp. NPDC008150]|uniref:hypothetical protein n=1 Tax=Streptomyces sp. NPDC008150 TaxID=3364816 RepID=UPI0036E8F4C1
MSGGRQYWNEDTQRWEESGATGSVPTPTPPPAPVGPPPAVPPAHPPTAPDGTPVPGPGAGPAVDPEAETFWSGLRRPNADDHDHSGGPDRDADPGGSDGTWSDSAWSAPERSAGFDAGAGGTGSVGGTAHGDPYPYPPQWSPAPDDTGRQPAPGWDGAPPWDPERGDARDGRRNRRVMWAVVAAVAVVAVAVCLVVVRTADDGKDDKQVATGGGTSARSSPGTGGGSPTGTSSSPTVESPSDSPSASADSVPPGFEVHDDAEGFRMVVPAGWTRTTAASSFGMRVVNLRSPDAGHRIQVYQVEEPTPDDSFREFLSDRTAKAPGFRELSLTNLDQGDFTGSRLEYLADSIRGEPDVGTWHVFDERFVAGDDRVYAIAVYGPDAGGTDDELATLTTALDSFCPSGAPCAATDTD